MPEMKMAVTGTYAAAVDLDREPRVVSWSLENADFDFSGPDGNEVSIGHGDLMEGSFELDERDRVSELVAKITGFTWLCDSLPALEMMGEMVDKLQSVVDLTAMVG